MKKIIFIIYLNILFVVKKIVSSSPLMMPIESFIYQTGEESEKVDSETKNFIYELFNSNTVSTVKIGSKLYPLTAFININSAYFYLSEKCNIDKSSSFDYKKNFNYNRYQSDSFDNKSSFNITFGTSSHACMGRENFKVLDHEKKEINLENIDFILSEDTNENKPNCLYIGLLDNQYSQTSFKDYTLITQLKQKKFINEYCWFILFNKATKYNNDNSLYDPDEIANLKGNIFFGDFPHNFDTKNFYKSQLINTYTSYTSSNIMKWELKFNKIYFKNNDAKEIKIDDKIVKIDPSNYLIFAPKEYLELIIENFFQKYIDEKICSYAYFEEYTSIYCHKSDKFSIDKIKTFPTIYFEHINLEYTFELTYKDLFVEKDNIYWFLVVSDYQFNVNDWILGNLFMRKYQFVFNLDTKEIGFYNPKLTKEQNGDGNNSSGSKTILYILLIIALIIIIIGVGIFIKMKFFPGIAKKKRANELDDDYEYVSDKKERNNNMNSNENENKLFNTDNNIN